MRVEHDRMKFKLLGKNLGVIILANLLMGCANQVTPSGEAKAQENPKELQNHSPPLEGSSKNTFSSKQEEYLYKILVGEIAAQRGQTALAIEYFYDVAEYTQDPNLAERATRIALDAQNYSLAVKAARLWVKFAPKDPQAYQMLSGMLLHEQRTEEAVQQLEAMLDNMKGESQEKLETIALFVEQHKDRKYALELMEKLVSKRQNDPIALLTYARLLIHVNSFDKAVERLKQLLKVAPEHDQGVPLYAYVLDKQDHTDQALQWLHTSLLKHPEKYEWRLVYARMLAKTEQFDKAIEQYLQLLPQASDKADILYALGVLSLQTEQLSTAKNYFLELLKIGEREDTAYYYLGQIFEMEKDLDQALSWYKKIEGNVHYLNAQARIAMILVEQGHLDQALEHLHNIRTENEEDSLKLLQFEAELLIDQKQYERAMDTYNRALTQAPDNTELLYMRALLAEQMGQMDQLEQDLRHILAIDPNHIQALNALGYSLADTTDRYQEAYELVSKAFKLRPDDYYVLDSMGWVLHKMGRHQEASVFLQRALAKKNDPEISAHLGEVLWANGEKEKAKKVWEDALKEFPEDEKLRDVVNRFLP